MQGHEAFGFPGSWNSWTIKALEITEQILMIGYKDPKVKNDFALTSWKNSFVEKKIYWALWFYCGCTEINMKF